MVDILKQNSTFCKITQCFPWTQISKLGCNVKKGLKFPCAACRHPVWISVCHPSDTWFPTTEFCSQSIFVCKRKAYSWPFSIYSQPAAAETAPGLCKYCSTVPCATWADRSSCPGHASVNASEKGSAALYGHCQ